MSDMETWITRAAAVAIVTVCVGLFVRLRKVETGRAVADERMSNLGGRDTGAGAVHALAGRIDSVERQLVDLTATLRTLPDAREFSALNRSIATVQGDVSALRASVEGMDKMISGLAAQVGKINTHLLASAR